MTQIKVVTAGCVFVIAAAVVAFTYFKIPQLCFSNFSSMRLPIHVLFAQSKPFNKRFPLACSRRSDSGERCEEKRRAKK